MRELLRIRKRQGDKETGGQGDKETRRREGGRNISLSPCPPVPLSPCLPIILLLLQAAPAYTQGHTLLEDRVVVETAEHWNRWAFPRDVVDVSPSGTVRPRLFRKNTNAVLNAEDFETGGINGAGSNLPFAGNVMDGDPTTSWGPDPDAPLRDWWVEIDLGRVVSATKIVVRFPEKEDGDPFLQFEVLVSDGKKAFAGSDLLNFWSVGKTKRPNKEERVFEYELEPIHAADPWWKGSVIQYVQIAALDSDRDRAEEITKAAYEALSAAQQGAVVYAVVDMVGREIEVDQEVYEAADPEEKRPVRYYRRERPRLAEVEVWTLGDNMGLGVLERGGNTYATGARSNVGDVFDGDYVSYWLALLYIPLHDRGRLEVDLGALFWVDTIRLVTSPAAQWKNPMIGYALRASDGTRAPDGTLVWYLLSPVYRIQNSVPLFRFEERFTLRKIRFLDFRNTDSVGRSRGPGVSGGEGGSLHELQLYGQGYVPELTLTSDLITLGGDRNLMTISWEGTSPPGTAAEIRTRTGDELDEVKHFYDKNGQEVTELRWSGLPGFSRGEVVTKHIPGAGWSGWSPAYQNPGDPIVSPSPRKYMMLQVRFSSETPDTSATLDRIEVAFRPPLAKRLEAEISPDRNVLPARTQEFVCFLKPTFLPGNPGLDEILLTSSEARELGLLEMQIGSETEFLENRTDTFVPDETGRFRNAEDSELTILSDHADSLRIRLPRVLGAGSIDLLMIRFQTTVYLNGTVFRASVGNSAIPNVWQRADPGDATYLTSSQGMQVFVPAGDRILSHVEIAPNPFSPNGDGVNDEISFRFRVFKVNTERAVEVTIHALGGRKIAGLLEQRPSASGEYEIAWDGRDEDGGHVAPGIYIARIRVDVDSEEAKDAAIHRPVYVVY